MLTYHLEITHMHSGARSMVNIINIHFKDFNFSANNTIPSITESSINKEPLASSTPVSFSNNLCL